MAYLTRQKRKFLAAIKAGKTPEQAYAAAYSTLNMSKTVIRRRIEILSRETGLLPERESGTDMDAIFGGSIGNGSAIAAIGGWSPPAHFIQGMPEIEDISRMLIAAYAMARDDGRAATAMISATLALAKLHGFMSEKNESGAQVEGQELARKIQEARQRVNGSPDDLNQGKNS